MQVVKLEERVQVYYCSTLVREIDLAIQRSTMVERWIPLPQPVTVSNVLGRSVRYVVGLDIPLAGWGSWRSTRVRSGIKFQ